MEMSRDDRYKRSFTTAYTSSADEFVLKSLHLWFLLSSIVLAGLFYVAPALPLALLGLKDLPLYFAVVVCLVLRPLRAGAITALFALTGVMAYLAVAFLASPAEPFVKVASIRQLAVFFVLVLLGSMLGCGQTAQLKLYRYIVRAGVWIVVLGVIIQITDLLAGGFLAAYFDAKAIPVLESGYPFFFIEPIPEFLSPWLGEGGVIRLVSTLLDPINFGHSLVAWLCILAYRPDVMPRKLARQVVIGLFLLALLMTFSKGAWLHLALTVVFLNFRRSYLVSAISLAGLAFAMFWLVEHHLGLALHLAGLLAAFESISMFGLGLGMVGNYSTLFGETHEGGIADSFLALLIGQIGIVGALIWMGAIAILMHKIKANSFLRPLLLAQLLVSSLSENAFNFFSIATLAFAIGIELAVGGRWLPPRTIT